MNMQDKQVVPFPKEREESIRAIGERFNDKSETLSKKEQDRLWECMAVFRKVAPNPRVSKIIGEFLVEMAEEQYRQDAIFGTDSDSENQVVMVMRKNSGHETTE